MLVALLIGMVSGTWAEEVTVTYTFTSRDWKATVDGNEANWTSGKQGAGFSNNGIQVTSNSTYTGANGTTPVEYSNITKIVATYNTNKSDGKGTIDAKIGNNKATTQNWAYSSGDGRTANYTTEFNYETPQSGAVTITLNTTTNSIYLVSIAITYEETAVETSPLTSIAVDASNARTVFHVGDEFSYEGAVVTATYEDETTNDVTSDAIFSTPDMTTVGSKTITVSYSENGVEKTTTYNITVNAPATLSSISLSGTYSTEFTQGDAFSSEGIVVTANYDDGTTKDVTDEATFSGYDMTTTGEQTITVTYGEKTFTYTITVNEYTQPKEVTVNMNYLWLGSSNGSNLSSSQLPVIKEQDNVTITITDGTSNRPRGDADYIRVYKGSTIKFEAPTGYNITEIVFTTGGNNTWNEPSIETGSLNKQTWTGEDTEVEFSLSGTCYIASAKVTLEAATPKVLSSIALSGDYATTFYVGDAFSTEGMTVTATYDNGKTADVTASATFSGYDMTNAGEQTVTVSYTEGEVTKTATYTITIKAPPTLTSISVIVNNPIELYQGDEFSSEGIVVTANYDDDTTNDVTADATFSGYDMSTIGEQTVTVTYGEKTDTYTITVVVKKGTQNNPYTVAEAIAAIDAGTGVKSVYATGIVSEIVNAYNSQYGNISYNISVDGTTSGAQLQAYRGMSYNGDSFTSADDIQVGDVVVVYGNLTKYGSTYEFAQGNQLVKLVRKTIPSLTFQESSYSVGINGELTITATSSDSDGVITYSSSNTDVAEIDPSTGEVLAYQAGKTIITASIAETNTYKSTTAEVTLFVTDSRTPVTVITALSPTTVYIGQSGSFSLTETKAGEATYSFTSSDNELLLVDGNEFVGIAAGEVTVSATATPISDSFAAVEFESMVTVAYKYAAPSIADATFTGSTNVTIDAIDGAVVYYTTDGTEPTTSSTAYTGVIALTETTTIMAIAIDADGCVSPVAKATYTKEIETKSAIELSVGQSLEFSDFNDLGGYADNRSDDLIASDGNKYTWTGSQYCASTNGTSTMQMRASRGTLTSPTVKTSTGFILTLEYTSNATPSVTLDSKSLVATSSTSTSAVYTIEKTEATVTISAGSKATYIESISFSVPKPSAAIAFEKDGEAITEITLLKDEMEDGIVVKTNHDDDATVTYVSSDESVATFENGVLYALSEGTATITATVTETNDYASATATLTVQVIDKLRQTPDISFGETPIVINLGEKATYTATTTSDGTIVYSSSAEDIVSVDPTTGEIEAKGVGRATIMASVAQTDNYLAAEATYTILIVNPNEETFTFINAGYDRGEKVTEVNGTNAGLVFEKGDGTTASAFYDDAVRFYGKNILTVVSDTKAIASVAITFVSGTTADFECTTEGYTSSTESNVITFTAAEGKALDEVVFYRNATKKYNQIQAIVLTYTDLVTDTYTRSVATGNWGTICLAGKVRPSRISGATFYRIAGKDVEENPNYLVLEEVTMLEAGKAYIFQATDETVELEYLTATVVDTEVSNGGLVGSFTGQNVKEGMYLLSGGKIVKCGTGCSIAANRAYIDMDAVPVLASESASEGLVKLFLGTTDAVRGIDADNLNGAVIYDLSGRRLQNAQRGLYIVNGKKVAVK